MAALTTTTSATAAPLATFTRVCTSIG
jgi:hypothetical protein